MGVKPYPMNSFSPNKKKPEKLTCDKESNILLGLHLLQAPLVGPYALDKRDGEWVELVGLMGLVDDGQRDPEAEILEVAHLLAQLYYLRQEVDLN